MSFCKYVVIQQVKGAAVDQLRLENADKQCAYMHVRVCVALADVFINRHTNYRHVTCHMVSGERGSFILMLLFVISLTLGCTSHKLTHLKYSFAQVGQTHC